jgi:hypothetical protein
VCIRTDRDSHPLVPSLASDPPVEIEPVGIGVDLEGHASGSGLVDDSVQVDRIRIAREEQPAGWMTDDR